MSVISDSRHLGHFIIEHFLKWPNEICQRDAATGESEINASVLARSIQLTRCFRKFGVKPGDVLILGGKNHFDVHIPFYAALMNGMPIAGWDPLFREREVKKLFTICSPTIAFCQKELLDTYETIVEELRLNTEVICFDEGKNSLASFIEQYDDKEDQEEFRPVTIEPKAVIQEHPGVHDVSVTSVPHEYDGEHPVACVIRSPGSSVTAEEIKEIVVNKLADSHRLRGGVIFMDQLPMTSSGKLARGELHKMVLTLHRG